MQFDTRLFVQTDWHRLQKRWLQAAIGSFCPCSPRLQYQAQPKGRGVSSWSAWVATLWGCEGLPSSCVSRDTWQPKGAPSQTYYSMGKTNLSGCMLHMLPLHLQRLISSCCLQGPASMPRSSKHYWALDLQTLPYSKKMLASWLVPKNSKSWLQYPAALCKAPCFQLGKQSFWKVFILDQLQLAISFYLRSLQSAMPTYEFNFATNEQAHKQIASKFCGTNKKGNAIIRLDRTIVSLFCSYLNRYWLKLTIGNRQFLNCLKCFFHLYFH